MIFTSFMLLTSHCRCAAWTDGGTSGNIRTSHRHCRNSVTQWRSTDRISRLTLERQSLDCWDDLSVILVSKVWIWEDWVTPGLVWVDVSTEGRVCTGFVSVNDSNVLKQANPNRSARTSGSLWLTDYADIEPSNLWSIIWTTLDSYNDAWKANQSLATSLNWLLSMSF